MLEPPRLGPPLPLVPTNGSLSLPLRWCSGFYLLVRFPFQNLGLNATHGVHLEREAAWIHLKVHIGYYRTFSQQERGISREEFASTQSKGTNLKRDQTIKYAQMAYWNLECW